MTNSNIEKQFSLLAKLMDLHNLNSFKTKAIATGAFQIDKLNVQLSNLAETEIANLPNIGIGVSKKIIELITTGKLNDLEDLKNITPIGVQQLLLIKGLGPKKCRIVWQEMGIESPTDFLYACNENRLINYKGFGDKTQALLLQATQFYLQSLGKFLYADAEPIIDNIKNNLIEIFGTENIFITGDFARQETIIEYFEFVINTPAEFIVEGLEANTNILNIEYENDEITFDYQTYKCKIYSCEAANAMEQLFFTQSSPEFLEAFTQQFPDVDYTLQNHNSDKAIFEQANIPYLEPYLRTTNQFINSQNEALQISDIKGIIHNHSTYSDGANTLEQMVLACIKLQMQYFVISDHSQYASYAGGLDADAIYKQHAEIDMLNKKYAPFKIYKSIECDILPNGDLDYNTEILKTFDLVIASIHSVFNMTEVQAMQRIQKAIENPFTTILGHPTGRLLLGRNGYAVDMYKIIDLCKINNVVVELNANPRRLDIDWQYINYAIKNNVLVSINPDAHSVNGINDIKFGVLAAQKANLNASQNLSSFTLSDFEKFLTKQHLKQVKF